ncbi:MAG: ABC transporter ATP-binding protein [Rhodospirillaceae bacterium]|nr:ABC transporter ATP-binding protein [Rhodospirillaceae bacterium]
MSPTPLADRSTRLLVGRLVRDYVRPHLWRLAVAAACMAVTAGATAALAKQMEPMLDQVFAEADEVRLHSLAFTVFVIFVVKGLADYGQQVLINHVGQRVVADLQIGLFAHLVRADLAFFHDNPPGNLVSRFINDTNMVRDSVSTVVTNVGRDLLTLVFLVGLMVYQDWLLSLVAVVAFPLAIVPSVRVGRRMRRVSRTTQEQRGELTAILDEGFQGARQVKAYGMEDYEARRATSRIEQVFRLTVTAARTRAALSPLMEALGGCAIVGVLLYGGHMVMYEGKTPGAFFSFVTALLLAYQPVKRLAQLNTTLQEGLAAADRVFHLMDLEPRIVDKPGARPLMVRGGAVQLDRVGFRYDTGADGPPALDDLSIDIPGGATVALVGASGAGKSTVLNLIPRLFDVSAGAVRIDGQDVRDVTLASLRGSIALVSQDTLLFDDTVAANIRYGTPRAGPAEIIAAAKAANAHDFIAALPQGYDTPVGPRGVKLSGGQRQRIAIARAMLRDAPILLLDEATSALDTESERQVQRALARLKQGRTTVVIAHRLSTVVSADRIFVLDKGRLVEFGTHAELLARGGAYARLYALQFAREEDVAPAAGGSPGAAAPADALA